MLSKLQSTHIQPTELQRPSIEVRHDMHSPDLLAEVRGLISSDSPHLFLGVSDLTCSLD